MQQKQLWIRLNCAGHVMYGSLPLPMVTVIRRKQKVDVKLYKLSEVRMRYCALYSLQRTTSLPLHRVAHARRAMHTQPPPQRTLQHAAFSSWRSRWYVVLVALITKIYRRLRPSVTKRSRLHIVASASPKLCPVMKTGRRFLSSNRFTVSSNCCATA